MFAFNTQTNHWRRIDALESKPTGRYGHSAVVYNNTAFIFGGFDSDGFVSNDLLTFDLIQCKWLPKITKTQQWPIPRYHHTVTLFGHLMFVFGGLDTSFISVNYRGRCAVVFLIIKLEEDHSKLVTRRHYCQVRHSHNKEQLVLLSTTCFFLLCFFRNRLCTKYSFC
jgi:hypothetical protein